MNWQDYIEERADVMNGKPVFKGTRVTVEHVLQELANGMAEDDLLRGHPRLTRDHLRAASNVNVSLLVAEKDVTKAVKALHERFFETENGRKGRKPR